MKALRAFDFVKLLLSVVAAVQGLTLYYVQDIAAIKERLIRLETIVAIRLGVVDAPPASLAGTGDAGSRAENREGSSRLVILPAAAPVPAPSINKGITP